MMQALIFSLFFCWSLFPPVIAQDSKPGAPVHPGQPANCVAWHTVKEGDDCETVPRSYYITKEEFLAWNPAVSTDCLTNFWLKYAYCVKIDGATAIYTTAKCTTTSKTRISTTNSDKDTSASATKVSSTKAISPTITSGHRVSETTSESVITTALNTTYSVRNPVSTWNITTPTTDVTWPPKATQSGQPKDCNKWHLVRGRQSCRDVLSTHSSLMKKEDFFKWNPEVHEDCSGLFVGYWYCVGVKSNSSGNLEWETSTPPFTPPPEPTSHKPTKLTPAGSDFTPKPTHGPLPTDCVNYHQAEADESCRDILKAYNYLSKDQFFKYNPVLDKNCDGLWKGNWYCVSVKSELLMPPTVTTTPSEVPSGSPKHCKAWYYTTGGETCDQLARIFGTFNVKEFIAMNPSVLDDCDAIQDNTWYCVAGPGTPTTRTADVTTSTPPTTSIPTQSSVSSDCKEYWLVSEKDTCKSIRRANSISLEKLLTWNPALGSTCSGLEPDSYVCVGVRVW
ncbi:carbohydrate-binding module family 50 [Fusarium sp. NRRL 25303]|nr:carbohydrate-binding module family 50 [Fusarium sp. NRRL 25303]